MKIAILGRQDRLARATCDVLRERGHEPDDCGGRAIIFPCSEAGIEAAATSGRYEHLVLRSHACAYGSNPRNPGFLTEDRISLLPEDAPEVRWLRSEKIVLRHPSAAVIRLATVLSPPDRKEEADPIVRKLSASCAITPAGRDPNLQFLSLRDAASALAAAVESSATGVFNAAPSDSIPLKQALRAAGTTRIGLVKPLAPAIGGASIDALDHTWAVSSKRALRELDWKPSTSSIEALREFLESKNVMPRGLRREYDPWGLDVDYIRAWGAWFWFLRNVYWRIDFEGMENIPASGRALFVSNHRGFMPLDAVMHLSLIFTHTGRIPRFLINHSLLRFPFLSNFLTKLGGVVASQENAARLFDRDDLVAIFPEGIRGTFLPYRRAYKLLDFAKTGFARIAIENQAPVIPAAVIGHAEIFPVLARFRSSFITRELGWPYFPIAPMWPLAPIPIPSKWHVRVLPPVPLEGLKPSDAENAILVRDFSHHIQNILQRNIDDMLSRRKSIFWGKVLHNPASSASPPFKTSATAGGSL